MVNISTLSSLFSEIQAKYCIDWIVPTPHAFQSTRRNSSVTGTSFETVISKRVLLAIWIGNVNDMGIENPLL